MDISFLKLHELKGDRKGIWSVTVQANWRITFQFKQGDVEIVNYEGVVTEIDLESGYCNWENIQGDMMPSVNISAITLHKRL